MIGLKVALAGLVVWFAFGLGVQKLKPSDGAIWWIPASISCLGLLAIPIGFVVWVFE
jgi:hypothetical protein